MCSSCTVGQGRQLGHTHTHRTPPQGLGRAVTLTQQQEPRRRPRRRPRPARRRPRPCRPQRRAPRRSSRPGTASPRRPGRPPAGGENGSFRCFQHHVKIIYERVLGALSTIATIWGVLDCVESIQNPRTPLLHPVTKCVTRGRLKASRSDTARACMGTQAFPYTRLREGVPAPYMRRSA